MKLGSVERNGSQQLDSQHFCTLRSIPLPWPYSKFFCCLCDCQSMKILLPFGTFSCIYPTSTENSSPSAISFAVSGSSLMMPLVLRTAFFISISTSSPCRRFSFSRGLRTPFSYTALVITRKNRISCDLNLPHNGSVLNCQSCLRVLAMRISALERGMPASQGGPGSYLFPLLIV